jgi:hypothetical protein
MCESCVSSFVLYRYRYVMCGTCKRSAAAKVNGEQ